MSDQIITNAMLRDQDAQRIAELEAERDAWESRAGTYMDERDALRALLREASINLLSVGYLRGEAEMSLYDRIVAALAAKEGG